MMDIGKDLQQAYDEGYEQCKKDAIAEIQKMQYRCDSFDEYEEGMDYGLRYAINVIKGLSLPFAV